MYDWNSTHSWNITQAEAAYCYLFILSSHFALLRSICRTKGHSNVNVCIAITTRAKKFEIDSCNRVFRQCIDIVYHIHLHLFILKSSVFELCSSYNWFRLLEIAKWFHSIVMYCVLIHSSISTCLCRNNGMDPTFVCFI